MLTDTHAHLFWDSFENDFDEMIQRSLNAGVTTIINVGTDLETSKEALLQVQNKLATFPKLTTYSAIGIHPHDAIKYQGDNNQDTTTKIQKDIDKLEEIYRSDPTKVVAVGECGLDFMFENNPDFILSSKEDSQRRLMPATDQMKDLQKQLLKAQVGLSKKLNLPLLIHTRESTSTNSAPAAWDEIWDLIKDHFGILHCYSGDLEITKKAMNSNFLISFAATITYPKNEFLRAAARLLPLEKIVLETDCPFLPPQSKRGQRNEPATIKEIAELIANLKNISLEKVANQTTQNAKEIFLRFNSTEYSTGG